MWLSCFHPPHIRALICEGLICRQLDEMFRFHPFFFFYSCDRLFTIKLHIEKRRLVIEAPRLWRNHNASCHSFDLRFSFEREHSSPFVFQWLPNVNASIREWQQRVNDVHYTRVYSYAIFMFLPQLWQEAMKLHLYICLIYYLSIL